MKKLPMKNTINLLGPGVILSNQLVDKRTKESILFRGFTISQYLDFALFVLHKQQHNIKTLLVEYVQTEIPEEEVETTSPILKDVRIENNPGVNNVKATLEKVTIEQPSTDSDKVIVSANDLRYISLPDNLDIKRIYRAKLNQREDIEYRTKFFEDNNFKRNHLHSIPKDEPIRLHPNQGPAKILVGLYQHTSNINLFAITAVNMETMKMYDSLKTSEKKSTQYGAANTIINLPIEEALSLIDKLQSIWDSNTRDDNFSGWNLSQDGTPYELRLPTTDELLMEIPNANTTQIDKPILVYCKRFHPVTKQWTYGHVLLEAEEKYLHQIKHINFDTVQTF